MPPPLFYRSGPRVADEADVEYELVPRVALVVQDDWVSHDLVAVGVGGDVATGHPLLGDHVLAEALEDLRGKELVVGLKADARTNRGMELSEEDPPDRSFAPASLEL